MANAELIDSLNRVLSLELAGVIQYLQHSFLVTGREREVFRSFFRALSGEALAMARRLDEPVALTAALSAELLVTWSPDNLETRLALDDELVIVAAANNIAYAELIGRHFRMVDHLESGDRTAADPGRDVATDRFAVEEEDGGEDDQDDDHQRQQRVDQPTNHKRPSRADTVCTRTGTDERPDRTGSAADG